jgi:lysyl-tRNA synthetase class 2
LFFDDRNYLELDTPLLSDNLIPESCLEVFQTERLFPFGSKKTGKPLWLIPSPEIWMKKIITQYRVDVYQICKCFRNGESEGRLHNSEFTMLEYYTMNADYMDSLTLTEKLTKSLMEFLYHEPSRTTNQSKITFEKITVAESFKRWAGFDLFAAVQTDGAMEKEARRLGLDPPRGMTTAELYDLIFIHAVEPNLKTKNPVFLLDYPAFVPCLAKNNQTKDLKTEGLKTKNSQTEKSQKTVERWELYWNGIELANCFSEEQDPQKVKEFFINEEAEKERSAIVKHNVDHDYWKIFERGFPRCSGVAMGVDRFIMALTQKSSIDGVLPFPEN